MIKLDTIEIPLEKTIPITIHEDASCITQTDFQNAILHVRVAPDIRRALNSINVKTDAHLDTWTIGGKGTYVGTWAKRLSKFLYKKHKIKLDPYYLSIISERIAKTLVGGQERLEFVFSKEMWTAGEFGERSNSCWFPGREYSYCSKSLMQSDNGGAIKIFQTREPRGRCWFYNLDGSLLIFNAYDRRGKLDLLGIARLLSLNYGMNYIKHTDVIIDLAYINGRSIYSIGNPPLSRPVNLNFAQRAVRKVPVLENDPIPAGFPADNISCPTCGKRWGKLLQFVDGGSGCERCSVECSNCHANVRLNDTAMTFDRFHICSSCSSSYIPCHRCYGFFRGTDERFCPNCRTEAESLFTCEDCGEESSGARYHDHAGYTVCEECRDDHYHDCDICEILFNDVEITYIRESDRNVCSNCLNEYYYVCHHCDEHVHTDDAVEINGDMYCPSCRDNHFSICDKCSEYEPNNDLGMVYVTDDATEEEYWCVNCRDEYATWCSECNDYYANRTEHSHDTEEDDEAQEPA